jgi:hypothetical protein
VFGIKELASRKTAAVTAEKLNNLDVIFALVLV